MLCFSLSSAEPYEFLVKLRNITWETNYVIVSQNALGMMGRRKLRKALPYNVSKMASNLYRHKNILLMNYSWFILSATNRPFQDAKVCGELVCSKCIENNEEVKFF
jgi:hypothetical protein